jgi:hypothetical protein
MSAKKSLRQYRAQKVAEFQFKQRLERIEWEEEVLKPDLERAALEMGTTLEIPQYIVHED